MYFKEAVYRNPDNLHAPRELMRAKIAHIVSMGFKEKDAISALEKYIDKTVSSIIIILFFNSILNLINFYIFECIFKDSVKHAVNFLKENNFSVDTEIKNDSDILINGYKNVIYKSDDEDDEPTSFKILNKILNYVPGQNKMIHLIAKPTHGSVF